jgi:hypothetical protein
MFCRTYHCGNSGEGLELWSWRKSRPSSIIHIPLFFSNKMTFILELILAVVGMFGILIMMLLLNICGFIGFTMITDPKNDSDKTYDALGTASKQKVTIMILLFFPIGLLLLMRQRRIAAWKDYLDTL